MKFSELILGDEDRYIDRENRGLFKLLGFEDKPLNENYSRFDYVLSRVKKDGLELQHASKRLRKNYRIVRAAVEQNGLALQFASEKLQGNKRIVLASVTENGNALQ